MERLIRLEDIDRSFKVSEPINVILKPRGFVTWCKAPYQNHPKGCPNFGERDDCPPDIDYFLDVYKSTVRIAALSFDFADYLKQKREVHPGWTERAIRNPRHFQGHLRAALRHSTNALNIPGFVPEYNPEAMGVNIHLTCKRAGIELEWPPTKVMYRIALLAQPVKP